MKRTMKRTMKKRTMKRTMKKRTMKRIPAIGSRAKVMHGTAKHTRGGLTKDDLLRNKHGRIVSRLKHHVGVHSLKYLHNKGYIARKGKFVLFRKRSMRTRKMRGGAPYGGPLSPHEY